MVKHSRHLRSAGAAFSAVLACTHFASPAQAQTYTEKVLHTFTGGADGAYPYTPLLRANGNFYGEALGGGNANCQCGTVFAMNRKGNETVLYSFTGTNGDGMFPAGPVIQDKQGDFYGTTIGGGDANCQCGTVFKIDPAGKETVLYAFTDAEAAQGPDSGVVRDSSGNLYGTNNTGGVNNNDGSIFKIDAGGNYTLLHSFNCAVKTDGCFPNLAPMMIDKKGNLFGVTEYGGAAGWGVVYEFATASNTLKILYSFSGASDGGYPTGALLRDKAGNYYGTTNAGGAAQGLNGNGVAYKFANGVQTVIYTVPGGQQNGNSTGPFGAGLVMDDAGNLYGTTSYSGANNWGSVFKIDASGKETTLYSFTGGDDGNAPSAPVTLKSNGDLYGTTVYGGPNGTGVVFEMTP